MIGDILFSIPSEFATGIADGSLIRIGTLLKDSATGQIVAHVQETGLAQQLLGGMTSSPFSPINALNLASSGYANIQLNQLKTMVEGLQLLQYANLGVSIAGIGVSAIGFAMMNKRLNNIESHITNLTKKLDWHFQELRSAELRKHYSQIYVLLEKANVAHKLTNSLNEWRNIASQLADESGFFRGEINYLLEKSKVDTDLFTSFIHSLALCNNARIECLLLANELAAAQEVAINIGNSYRLLFDNITPFQLVNSNNNQIELCQDLFAIKSLVQGIRDITDVALTKPFIIETLIEQGIDGHNFVTMLKEEKERPLLLLRTH
jgi:hypothetical protein